MSKGKVIATYLARITVRADEAHEGDDHETPPTLETLNRTIEGAVDKLFELDAPDVNVTSERVDS